MSNGRVHALDLQVAAPTRDQIIPNVLPRRTQPPACRPAMQTRPHCILSSALREAIVTLKEK